MVPCSRTTFMKAAVKLISSCAVPSVRRSTGCLATDGDYIPLRVPTVRQLSMLSADTPDELVSIERPIRRIRPLVELTLASLTAGFLGLNVGDPAFQHSSFAKNRRHLLDH